MTATRCGLVATAGEVRSRLSAGKTKGGGAVAGGKSGVVADGDATEGVRTEEHRSAVLCQLFFWFLMGDLVSEKEGDVSHPKLVKSMKWGFVG